jgi:hypothetical protein
VRFVAVGVGALLVGVAVGALVFAGDDGSGSTTEPSGDPVGVATMPTTLATVVTSAPVTSVPDVAETVQPVSVTAPPVTVVAGRAVEEVPYGDPERGTRDGSPLDDLPAGVSVLTDFGQRPDWSPDGEQLVFLDMSPLGDVWTVDVATGATHKLTGGFEHHGFSRAHFLANGDLLLCGPTSGPQPTADRPEAGRFTGVMSLLRAPFDALPEPLGVPCWEGMAAAHDSMRIAWNRSDIDYTDSDLVDRVVNGITEVWTGEIVDVGGRAAVANARKVLDRDAFGSLAVFEVQDFRPPDDTELLLTAYAYQGGEVLGLDLDSGAVRNYSSSSAYEEVEGVAADGASTYVERDIAYDGLAPGALDIWQLSLTTPTWKRITYFNRYAPYYASNPTESPDARTLAFQLSIDGDTEGEGAGLLLLDLTG